MADEDSRHVDSRHVGSRALEKELELESGSVLEWDEDMGNQVPDSQDRTLPGCVQRSILDPYSDREQPHRPTGLKQCRPCDKES